MNPNEKIWDNTPIQPIFPSNVTQHQKEGLPGIGDLPNSPTIPLNVQTEGLGIDIPIVLDTTPISKESLQKIVSQNAQTLFEYALANMDLLKDWGSLYLTEPTKELVSQTNRFIDPIVKYKTKIKGGKIQKLESLSEKLETASLIFTFGKMLNTFGGHIYKRIVVNAIENQLNSFKLKDSNNENIKKLEGWIEEQKKSLNNESIKIVVGVIALSPSAIGFITKNFMNVGEKFKLGNYAAGGLVGIAFKSLAVHGARSQRTTQAQWTEDLKENPQPVAANANAPMREVKQNQYNDDILIAPEELKKHVNGLIEDRKIARKNMNETHQKEFDSWFENIQKQNKFETINASCKKQGIYLETDFQITTIEAFKNLIETESTKETFFNKYLDKQETLEVMTRQHFLASVKKIVEKKHQIERKFLNFNLADSSITLSTSTLLYVATFVLKILAMLAVIKLATVTLVLAWSGIGLFALGLGLTITGLLLLRHYRPNVFSELIHGTQLEMALYKIPLGIQKLRQDLIKIKKLKLEMKQQEQIFAKKGCVIQTSEIKALETKIEALDEKISYWKEKLQPLKNQMKEAGWKDFQRSLGADLTQEGWGLGLNEDLVATFLRDNYSIDKNTKDFFKKHLGISLDDLKQQNKGMKVEIFEGIKNFFSLNEKKLLKFIQTQKNKGLGQ